MAQQESRALEHTIPHQRPCVCMDAVKINAPHQTPPLDLATPPGQSLYKKWWGVAKNLVPLNLTDDINWFNKRG
jgi:hypothetical protein